MFVQEAACSTRASVISWTAKQPLACVRSLILKMVVRLFVYGYIELRHKPSFQSSGESKASHSAFRNNFSRAKVLLIEGSCKLLNPKVDFKGA